MFIGSHRDSRLIEFRSFEILHKLLVDNVLGLYYCLHVVVLHLRLLIKTGILFIVFRRVKCFSYIFIHAAKVRNFFQLTK